ncbi:MAG TPA: ABC transporter permease [Candidatus Limnocylindrales bacterium]
MIREVAGVTIRQLLGRRRSLVMALLALVPVLVALIYRVGGSESGSIAGDREFLVGLFDALIVTLLLPLVALLFGTAAFGAEIEDGTVIYLLAKPVARLRLVLVKLLVSAGAAFVLVGGSALVAGLIVLAGVPDGPGVLVGYLVGLAAGALLYAAVFIAVSLYTGRALIAGLIYVLVWEGLLANLLAGIRFLSIRQYVLGVADAAGVGGTVSKSGLAPEVSIGLALVVLAVAVALGLRRLQRFEVPQAD